VPATTGRRRESAGGTGTKEAILPIVMSASTWRRLNRTAEEPVQVSSDASFLFAIGAYARNSFERFETRNVCERHLNRSLVKWPLSLPCQTHDCGSLSDHEEIGMPNVISFAISKYETKRLKGLAAEGVTQFVWGHFNTSVAECALSIFRF
jgi:hypothetical protein